MSAKNDRTAAAADRARIRNADPTAFLIDVMLGAPIAVRDIDGNIVGWDTNHQADIPLRASAATKLLERVTPALKSVEVDQQGGMTFRVVSPIPLPHGSRPAEIAVQPVTDEPVNALDVTSPPEPFRRRRRTP